MVSRTAWVSVEEQGYYHAEKQERVSYSNFCLNISFVDSLLGEGCSASSNECIMCMSLYP